MHLEVFDNSKVDYRFKIPFECAIVCDLVEESSLARVVLAEVGVLARG